MLIVIDFYLKLNKVYFDFQMGKLFFGELKLLILFVMYFVIFCDKGFLSI